MADSDITAEARSASPPGATAETRVIAVNRFYWPDHAATSQILGDLAAHLAAQGWSVRVVTSRLRYHDPDAHLEARATRDGVRIRRVWTSRMGRERLAGRMLDYLTFYLSAGAALLAEVRRGDVVLATTDPPLVAVVASLAARAKGARLVTWNHDVFPEIAAALGMKWTAGAFGRLLRLMRNRALGGAAINVTLSSAMTERMRGEGIPSHTLRVIPNWSDAEIRPVPRGENRLRREWGLEQDFVVGYSGNLGRAHVPDKVAELVRRSRHLDRLVWLFIGAGAGMDRIREMAGDGGPGKVQVRPYQRREDLSLSLSVPDLHLVALDPSCEGLIVPSKIYGILAAGRPILYLGDPMSAQAREIVSRGIGICLDPAAPEDWSAAIDAIRSDAGRLAEMSRRARDVSMEWTPALALAGWEAALTEAAQLRRAPSG